MHFWGFGVPRLRSSRPGRLPVWRNHEGNHEAARDVTRFYAFFPRPKIGQFFPPYLRPISLPTYTENLGEKGKSTGENSKKSSGEGTPKWQISSPLVVELYHSGQNAYIFNFYVRLFLYVFKTRLRKIKNLQCNFYMQQINSPEFSYVISWVWLARKGDVLAEILFQRTFSSDAKRPDFFNIFNLLHYNPSIFSRIFLFWCTTSSRFNSFKNFCTTIPEFHWNSPRFPRFVLFAQDFSSSNAEFLVFAPFFVLLH